MRGFDVVPHGQPSPCFYEFSIDVHEFASIVVVIIFEFGVNLRFRETCSPPTSAKQFLEWSL